VLFLETPRRRVSGESGIPLLDRKVPESYAKLQGFVKTLAENYNGRDIYPVLTKTEFM